jgi:DNA repair protein RadC
MEKYKLIKEYDNKMKRTKITSSEDAYKCAKNFWHEDIEIYESFFICMLNTANESVGYVKLSQGGINGTVVDIRILTKYVIDSLCSNVILFHNHPSGNLKPSKEDINITKKVKDALKLFDIKLLDHLILSKDGFYSLAEYGYI